MIKIVAPETWSPVLQEAAKLGDLKIIPYDVEIGYDFWSYGKNFLSCALVRDELTELKSTC